MSSENPEKPKKIHQPEFIILSETEEVFEEGTAQREHQQYAEFLQKAGKLHFSFGMRLLVLIATAAFVVVLFFSAVFAALAVVIAALYLFRNPEANKNMSDALHRVRKYLVIILGLLLAIFTPPLGIGLICLYFWMYSESMDPRFFSQVFKETSSRDL